MVDTIATILALFVLTFIVIYNLPDSVIALIIGKGLVDRIREHEARHPRNWDW